MCELPNTKSPVFSYLLVNHEREPPRAFASPMYLEHEPFLPEAQFSNTVDPKIGLGASDRVQQPQGPDSFRQSRLTRLNLNKTLLTAPNSSLRAPHIERRVSKHDSRTVQYVNIALRLLSRHLRWRLRGANQPEVLLGHWPGRAESF